MHAMNISNLIQNLILNLTTGSKTIIIIYSHISSANNISQMLQTHTIRYKIIMESGVESKRKNGVLKLRHQLGLMITT